jgi:hypothetical protein
VATLTIDTNDDTKVLRACRNMLAELIDELPTDAEAGGLRTAIAEVTADLRVATADTPADVEEAYDGVGRQVVSGDITPAADAVAVPPAVLPDQPEDHNGVPRDDDYCANAADPFYGSGPRKGQWKKRRGVADDTYDAWYASQCPATAVTTTTPAPVDSAAAFGAAPTIETAAPAPTDLGGLMAWLAAKQAAGLLSQQEIGQAYVDNGVEITDLLPPATAEAVKANVAKLYVAISAVAGA